METADRASHARDTIVAIATPAGAGGVGIVRLSGALARRIAETVCGGTRLRPRMARHARFLDADGGVLDDGLVLFFPSPASYTGEDVAELQAHGSLAVLHALVDRCIGLGARAARPGEFSERAFLGGKLDLAQAEAVADMIAAGDLHAARAARRALDGEFSRRVEALAAELLALRVHVEAAIDFADEPLDTLGGEAVRDGLAAAAESLDALLAAGERGRRLRDGLHAVIVGPPNAGKSSLLNALAGEARAIVTDIPGTTRDLLRETVRIGGIELTLVDTAGLRGTGDAIEREGIRRAREELTRADLALVVADARVPDEQGDAVADALAGVPQRLRILNKRDLLPPDAPGETEDEATLLVSARTGEGLDRLQARLRSLVEGQGGEGATGGFTARARHLEALRRAGADLRAARRALADQAPELAAESLRHAHDALGEITGRIAPDALLGHIFSTFCVGK